MMPRLSPTSASASVSWVLLPAAMLFVIGCSGTADYAPVTGVVKLDGELLAGAGVSFKPDQGPIATAVTNAQGEYQLMTGSIRGAQIGKHRISVAKLELNNSPQGTSNEENLPRSSSGGRLRSVWYTPHRYASIDTSGLSFEVRPGSNNVPLDLTTQP